MQYQHLVFEFARKIQPAVNLFNDYDATLDPSILAEFAHTVYRFGHSMLTETVDRYNPDWTVTNGGVDQEQIGLIEAFLNPVEFAASGLDAEAAAGAIAQDMTLSSAATRSTNSSPRLCATTSLVCHSTLQRSTSRADVRPVCRP